MLSAYLDGQAILLHQPKWDDQETVLRLASREKRIVAPCCSASVVLKWGIRKVRHFAHYPRTNCPYERWSEPESPEHMAGKVLLYEWCQKVFGSEARRLELECPLPETLQRPDLYLELEGGARFALEYQRSALSLKEWTERHQAYQSLGITDIWIFGENRLRDALPSPEQQARWEAKEPGMVFLNPRAFENAAAVSTPFERAWWRVAEQETMWRELELAVRTGREANPWFRRSALARLASLTFLDAEAAELHIYRAMRELPGHVDTRMASVCLRSPLGAPDLELTAHGFATERDRERLAQHEERVTGLDRLQAGADLVAEAPRPYTVAARPLDPALPPYFHEQAERRVRLLRGATFDPTPFLLSDQEEEQRRRLQERARVPEWRRIVERNGLTPENLFFLVGVPIPDDTVIQVHRTVWQAFLTYHLLVGRRTGSFPVRWVRQHLERRFGLDQEMVRIATFLMPGRLSDPDRVIGAYLNLLVAAGRLRNDHGSEHFRYHLIPTGAPPAFVDRAERWRAWAGLLGGRLRLEGTDLVGETERIPLTTSLSLP